MVSQRIDRNLLFGLVALRMRLIDRAQLVDALDDWSKDRSRTLAEILERRACLTAEQSTLVDEIVAGPSEEDEESVETRVVKFLMDNPPTPLEATEGMGCRYQILWPHAKGGLGEVFLAEDTDLHRRVALKEIQARHAKNPVSRGRFVAEAEITGKLEHPGVVPVYGLGTHGDGRPFYTMRFIKGEDLATAIRRFHSTDEPGFGGMEFRWLLRKLVDVCNTVAYAHSRGVVHRDLKPANVMIGPFGETLVMDWGVAKLIGRGAGTEVDSGEEGSDECGESDAGLQLANGPATVAGQAVGTPTYMSPEQAAGRLDLVGPPSDVYSLGVTLYVLLAGRGPFQGSVPEVLRVVQEGRFEPPRRHKARIPAALEAICGRAMALAPSERYQSALSLAADIDRWLADEPVSVWCEPWADRARRWVRRHQPLVAGWATAVAVALTALCVAVPLLSLAWRNELTARRAEQRQRILAIAKAEEALASTNKANDERGRAERALRFLVDAFRRPDPSKDGRTLKVVDFLGQAVRELDRSFGDQPLVKATLLNAIGETYNGLGLHQEGLPVFEQALSLRREQLGADDPATLASMNSLAMAYHDAGRLDLAIPVLTATLEKRRLVLGGDHPETIETMNDLAVAYWQTGRSAEAIPLYESTLARVRAALGDDHADTLTIMDNLAVAYGAAGRHTKAISSHEALIGHFQSKFGADHLATLVATNNLARAYQQAGRVPESIALYQQVLARLRAKLGTDHPTTLAAMAGLADSYRLVGSVDYAISLLESTWEGRRMKLGPDHPDTLMTALKLAEAYQASGQSLKAIPLARGFLQKTAELGGRLPANVQEAVPRGAKLLKSTLASGGTH